LPAPTPAAVDQTTASSSSIRQLDRNEVNMLVKRGEEFLMAGDFAAARLMLQRAAEAGDPHASLVLGATYDPIEVKHLGVRGIVASVATARTWYEKAEQFGSAEARRRLELLAKRDP
jgi:TPR repeat protein